MFKAIGRGIVLIVDGIAKMVAFILVTFGMFLPLIYTLLFFILKLIFKFQFTQVVTTLFVIGLALSVAGGLYFAFRRMQGKGKSKQINGRRHSENNNKPKKIRKQKHDVYEIADNENLRESKKNAFYNERDKGGESLPVRRDKPQDKEYEISPRVKIDDTPPKKSYTPPRVKIDETPLAEAYEPPQTIESESYYKQEAPLSGEAEELYKRLENSAKPNEQPLIFKSRTEQNVYIYEYSDRLQIYEKNGNKMIFIKTKFKKPTGDIKR